MLFFAFFELGSCVSYFWSGAPLFLNITVILALVCLTLAGILFTLAYLKTKKRQQKAIVGNSSVANQNKDFDPTDDKDPNRPMAIIRIPDGSDHIGIAGPIDLFQQLPHVTYEVMETIKPYKRIDDLFKRK